MTMMSDDDNNDDNDYDDDNNECLSLLNMYLPCDDGSNLEEYHMYLPKVSR